MQKLTRNWAMIRATYHHDLRVASSAPVRGSYLARELRVPAAKMWSMLEARPNREPIFRVPVRRLKRVPIRSSRAKRCGLLGQLVIHGPTVAKEWTYDRPVGPMFTTSGS